MTADARRTLKTHCVCMCVCLWMHVVSAYVWLSVNVCVGIIVVYLLYAYMCVNDWLCVCVTCKLCLCLYKCVCVCVYEKTFSPSINGMRWIYASPRMWRPCQMKALFWKLAETPTATEETRLRRHWGLAHHKTLIDGHNVPNLDGCCLFYLSSLLVWRISYTPTLCHLSKVWEHLKLCHLQFGSRLPKHFS